jgi:hypothetical protein
MVVGEKYLLEIIIARCIGRHRHTYRRGDTGGYERQNEQ